MSARGLNVFVSIGAKLLPSINSSATAVERRFGRMSQRLKFHAAEMRASYKGIARAADPLLGLAAAGGLATGLTGIFSAGAEYQHQVVAMKAMGRSSRELASAISQAHRTMGALPTSTLTDNLKVLNATTLAYGNFGHALENLTFNQRMGGMLSNMLGDKVGDVGETFNQLIRAMEIRGSALDQRRYQSETAKLFQAMIATHGTVTPEQILGFSQQANPAIKAYSERYLTRIVPSLIQEFGGERAGTMSTAWTNQILGRVGVGGKKLTEEWVRLGLVPRAGTGGNMSRTGWTAGALKGTNLALSDPLAWTEQVLLPALRKSGVDTNNSKAMMLATKKLFGRETAARLATTLADPLQRQRLHKDEALFSKALGPDQAYALALRNDPKMAMAATAASLKNLETSLGKAVTPETIAGLTNLARGINAIAGAFDRHPILAKGIGFALMGAAGLASLRLLGMGLGFALGPLRAFAGAWRFLFSSVGKNGPRVPFIKTLAKWLGPVGRFLGGIARKVGPALMRGLMRLGPLFLRGLMAVGPWLLRGLAAAFGLLSNPVGWAILAISVAVLIWKFRKEIANAWNTVVLPWFKNAWQGIKAWALSIDWKGIGWKIADALTFGLATKFRDAMANMPKPSAAAFAGNTGMNSRAGGLAGMRAGGGGVHRGRRYLVGERGPEVFTPGSTGTITANRHLNGALAGRRGGTVVNVGGITINGATDAVAVAREVDRAIRRYADNSANLSD